MTLPDPHGCPHCGHDIIAQRWNEPVCAMCGAPRRGVEPGCPVRNAMRTIDEAHDRLIDQQMRVIDEAHKRFIDDTTSHRYDCAMVSGPDTKRPRRIDLASLRCTCGASVTAETARERAVHGGGPRIDP